MHGKSDWVGFLIYMLVPGWMDFKHFPKTERLTAWTGYMLGSLFTLSCGKEYESDDDYTTYESTHSGIYYWLAMVWWETTT